MTDPKALYKLTYGLFVATSGFDKRDNGLITNTAIQVSSEPNRLAVALNKRNFTNELIDKSGRICLSALSTGAGFDIFERFGFQSGRDVDKFAGFADFARDESGLIYLTKAANAMFSLNVVNSVDCGSHTLYIADIAESRALSDAESMTYAYYFANVKPKPEAPKKASWVCKICGYVYEGDPLPDDFVCPICKHPASDFERLSQ